MARYAPRNSGAGRPYAFQVNARESEELCSHGAMSGPQLEPVKNMNEEWPMVSTESVPKGAEGNWVVRRGDAPHKLMLEPQISRQIAANRSD